VRIVFKKRLDNFHPSHTIELRISGWRERALELCGSKNVKVTITKSLRKGDNLTEYKATGIDSLS